jgi:hypothetical protein
MNGKSQTIGRRLDRAAAALGLIVALALGASTGAGGRSRVRCRRLLHGDESIDNDWRLYLAIL